MSFSIQPQTLKKLIDFYQPKNNYQQLKYMLYLKGQDQMYMNLQTSPFQGISTNSIQQRKSFFGENLAKIGYKFGIIQLLIKSLFQYTCVAWNLVISLLLFIFGLFSHYNSLPLSYVQGLSSFILSFVTFLIILFIQCQKYIDLKQIYSYEFQKSNFNVLRQNKIEQIEQKQLVVGDIVQLKQGMRIPADGWIIQGQIKVQQQYSYGKISANKTIMKACIHKLDKTIRNKTKKFTLTSKTKIQKNEGKYSTVVIGGSLVTDGQAKMLVFCVGKYSRKGQFEALLKNKNPYENMNVLEKKIQQFTYQLFVYGFIGLILIILSLIIKRIIQNLILTGKMLGNSAQISQFEFILLSFNFYLFLIPQGTLLGLALGLLFYKKSLLYLHSILIKQSIFCDSMSYIQYICHQKQKQKSYFKIKQWWNEEKVQIYDNQDDQRQQNCQHVFKQKTNSNYQKLFRNAMGLTARRNLRERSQRSLKFGSFRNLDQCFINYTKKKNYIFHDTMFQDQIVQQIPYDNIRKRTVIVTSCPEQIQISQSHIGKLKSEVVKKKPNKSRVSLQVPQMSHLSKLGQQLSVIQKVYYRYIVYVRGKHQTVLQLCHSLMSKKSGQINEINQQVALEIKSVIDSMIRRQLRCIILACKFIQLSQLPSQPLNWDQQGGYILLAIIGINDTRSTQQFQLVNKIKQLDVNLMISSTGSMEDSVSAANQIGIVKADQSSILINGHEFLHIVGGIICDKCKKAMCLCSQPGKPRIKNLDQFDRILKHLDVLANAQAFHKYTLAIGLKSNNISCATTGKKIIDIPSMLQSQVSLLSVESQDREQKQSKQQIQLKKLVCTIEIPNNSVQTLFTLIKESRICHKFIRRFLRLSCCCCLVQTITFLLSIFLFNVDFGIKLLHTSWVQCIILPLLALALALDSESQDNQNFSIMNQNIKKYKKDVPLIDSQGWKQIVTYVITQMIVIGVVVFLGPLFFVEKVDDVDSVIQRWQGKYRDQTMSTICSGLPFSILGGRISYAQTFQKYNIFSRHQTIVFALFSIMQIFNYFNFRQFNINEVNIFKNPKLLSISIVILTFTINLLFIQNIGSYAGLYPYGLLFQQWVICIALAMILWIVGIVTRLFPNLKQQNYLDKIRWYNRSYNLAVKSVVSKNQLTDFQVDQYFQLNPQFFKNTKNQ